MPDTSFKVVVIAKDIGPFVDSTFSDVDDAIEAFERMKFSTFVQGGKREYVFSDDEDILILDVFDKVLHAWNRRADRQPEEYDPPRFRYMERVRKIIGWQIVGRDGFNIHAEDDDPFGLNSYDILVDKAVDIAKGWVAENDGYRVIEVYDGDIEEPDFVSDIQILPPSPRVGRPMGY
jgi:hypothetical protein